MFLDEVNIWTSRLSKAECLPPNGLIQLVEDKKNSIEKKDWVIGNCSCLTALSWKLLNLFPENTAYVENFSVPGSDGESGLEIDY